MKIKGKTTWKQYYYLILLPLFFVLHGYKENYPLISLGLILLLFLKYLVISLLIVIVCFWLIRSWPTAIMLTFFIMAFQIFFGPIHDLLKSWFPDTFLVKYIFLLPLTLLALIILITYLKKTKPQFKRFSNYLNILFVIFLLIETGQLISKVISNGGSNSSKKLETFVSCKSCKKPDVFLIITDGYAGSIELHDIFHYDNSPFETELKKRGFHIVDSSISNYNYTPFTMGSMLDMQYLQGIEGRNQSLNDRKICFNYINRNPVVDFFRSNGYEIRNYSIFQFADLLPYNSTTFYKTGIDLILDQTFLSRLDRDIRFNLVTRFKIKSQVELMTYFHLKLNTALYEKTWNEITSPSEKPRFIYAHIEMPHYPYYFDKNGRPYPLDSLSDNNSTNYNLYLTYLQYANKKFLALIDHILNNSKEPPIILFMSDHGFREFKDSNISHNYQFKNLNAVYFPDHKYNGFYSGMSTVNQFRILLNSQFNQHLPLLKDSTIFLRE